MISKQEQTKRAPFLDNEQHTPDKISVILNILAWFKGSQNNWDDYLK